MKMDDVADAAKAAAARAAVSEGSPVQCVSAAAAAAAAAAATAAAAILSLPPRLGTGGGGAAVAGAADAGVGASLGCSSLGRRWILERNASIRLGSRDLRLASEGAAFVPPLRLLGRPVRSSHGSSSAMARAWPRIAPPVCGGGSRAVHMRTEEDGGASLIVLRNGPLLEIGKPDDEPLLRSDAAAGEGASGDAPDFDADSARGDSAAAAVLLHQEEGRHMLR